MSDESNNLPRRKILGSIGAIGAAGVLGGYGTSAYFGDEEGTAATFTAGELDLKIDWRSTHNGTVISEGGPTDVDGKVVGAFKDVKPCDTGCIELSIHNDTNPAYVWTAFEIVEDDDNNLNEPEMDAEGGDGFTATPEDGSSSGSCFFGGKLEEWNGSEFGVIENGQQTDADNEYVLTVDGKAQQVRVKLYVEETKDGELTKYSLESLTDGCGICAVDTKSGGGPAGSDDDSVEATTDFSGCVTGQTPVVESPSTVPNGSTLQGISYIEVFLCNTDGSSGEPQTDDDGELDECITPRFFEDPNEDCVPQADEELFFGAPYDQPVQSGPDLRSVIDGSLTRDAGGFNLGKIGTPTTGDDPSKEWYSLQWKLPCDCGNEVQSDSFQLNVYFYAQQARNNKNPESPWGDGDAQTCTPTCPDANIPSGVSQDFGVNVQGVDESNFPTVQATTRVETAAGGNGNLTASNFLVDEESGGSVCGQTVSNVTFGQSQEQTEADVMLVLDTSGSMTFEAGKFQSAKDGAYTLIGGDTDITNDPTQGGFDPTVNVGLAEFTSVATVPAPLGSDQSTVESEVDSLVSNDGTDLGEGIKAANGEFFVDPSGGDFSPGPNNRSGVPDFMIVLGNGDTSGGKTPADNAKKNGVTIFGIAYGSGADVEDFSEIAGKVPSDPNYKDFTFDASQDNIADIFDQIGQVISGTYTIEYETTQCEPDGSDRTVAVYVDDPNEGEATGTGNYTAPSS